MKTTLNPSLLEPSSPGFQISMEPESGERCLRARVPFAAGDVLATFVAKATHAEPARMTVQVDDHVHIELEPGWLRFLDHSCTPNVALDVETGRVIAVRALAVGDSLAYFYPATEWEMAEPFACRCGSPDCLGVVTGAAVIVRERPHVLARHWLAPHIARRVSSESVRLAS